MPFRRRVPIGGTVGLTYPAPWGRGRIIIFTGDTGSSPAVCIMKLDIEKDTDADFIADKVTLNGLPVLACACDTEEGTVDCYAVARLGSNGEPVDLQPWCLGNSVPDGYIRSSGAHRFTGDVEVTPNWDFVCGGNLSATFQEDVLFRTGAIQPVHEPGELRLHRWIRWPDAEDRSEKRLTDYWKRRFGAIIGSLCKSIPMRLPNEEVVARGVHSLFFHNRRPRCKKDMFVSDDLPYDGQTFTASPVLFCSGSLKFCGMMRPCYDEQRFDVFMCLTSKHRQWIGPDNPTNPDLENIENWKAR